MRRPPPRSTRTDTLFPYTTLFRSCCRTVARGAPSGYGTLYRGELHTDPNEDFTYDPRAFAGDSEAVHGNLTVTAEWDNLMLTSISGYDHRTFDTLADQDRSPDGTIFLLTPRAPGSSPRRLLMHTLSGRSDESRVGEEGGSRCRYRWAPYH